MENPFKKLTIDDLLNDRKDLENKINELIKEFSDKHPLFRINIELEYSTTHYACSENENISAIVKLDLK